MIFATNENNGTLNWTQDLNLIMFTFLHIQGIATRLEVGVIKFKMQYFFIHQNSLAYWSAFVCKDEKKFEFFCSCILERIQKVRLKFLLLHRASSIARYECMEYSNGRKIVTINHCIDQFWATHCFWYVKFPRRARTYFFCLKNNKKILFFSKKVHKHTIFGRSVGRGQKPPCPPPPRDTYVSYTENLM